MKNTKLSDLICQLTNIRLLPIKRQRGTFLVSYVNFKTNELRSLYIQFSLKDPWWLPKKDEHYGKMDIPLSGWLFFYFSLVTEGIIYPGDKTAKITDKDGNTYFCAKLERKIADDYHDKVKKGKKFFILHDSLSNKIILQQVGLKQKT